MVKTFDILTLKNIDSSRNLSFEYFMIY